MKYAYTSSIEHIRHVGGWVECVDCMMLLVALVPVSTLTPPTQTCSLQMAAVTIVERVSAQQRHVSIATRKSARVRSNNYQHNDTVKGSFVETMPASM